MANGSAIFEFDLRSYEMILSRSLMVNRSLLFYRSTMFLLALGVAAATAVILGALLVGDSVRGSLSGLIVDRLGRIEQVMVAPWFITQAVADRLGKSKDFPSGWEAPVPAILFPKSSAEYTKEKKTHRAGSILVAAIDESFWKMQDGTAPPSMQGRQVILNQALADELHVSVGEEVTLRLPVEQSVPSDSPLSRRDENTQGLTRLKVVAIIPNQGLGQFDLRASQKPPRDAFVPLELVQRTLKRDQQINALFLARKTTSSASTARDLPQSKILSEKLLEGAELTLEDLGIRIERITKKFPESETSDSEPAKTIYDYYHITSDQLLLPPESSNAIQKKLGPDQCQGILTYLANNLEKEETNQEGKEGKKLFATYSTVTAIDSGATFSLRDVLAPNGNEKLRENEAVINQWLADRLGLKVGDTLHMSYYLPETSHGKQVEAEWKGKVVGIAPLTEPKTEWTKRRSPVFDKAPTPFNDPNFTPEVPGFTDQASLQDLDLPFPLKLDPTKEDDEYWKRHHLTPKVYISLAEGEKLFGSRFGKVSSLRVSVDAAPSVESLSELLLPELRKSAANQGLLPIPIRAQQLAAASGTTPFDALFLSLSFFVIVAALILVSLLFRLGVEQRSDQWGLLLALGWQRWQVRRLLLREGILVAVIGAILGIALGFGYAKLMMLGLSGWWVGAVSVPFLQFHATSFSVVLGAVLGVATAWGTIWWASLALRRVEPLRLLRGKFESDSNSSSNSKKSKGSWLTWIAIGSAVLGLLLIPLGWTLTGEEQAGAYLGTGMLVLVSCVIACYLRLRSPMRGAKGSDTLTMRGFAVRSATRNPLRSTLAIGLIAVSSFLVLAISLFQAKPTESASGGYAILAESSQPIIQDLGDQAYQREILGPKQASLTNVTVESIRLRPGDDASCNNLYQAMEPRVLGLPRRFMEADAKRDAKKRFPWASHAKVESEEEQTSYFALLNRPGDGSREKPFPVVLDMNTAMWSLHRGVSMGEVFSFEFDGKEIYFQTVGLLKNSLLQGYLVLGEQNFVKAFPEINGYQFYLVDTGSESIERTSDLLEDGWGDEGLDAVPSASILRQLLGVQNTYLSAFQALGALGLLLGTFGLAVAQTRSVIERRSEIALLQSLGFSRKRVNRLLMSENASLLLLGVLIGGGCALVAILPAWLGGQSVTESFWPLLMLLIILVCGWLSGLFAVMKANQLRLLDSLRGR